MRTSRFAHCCAGLFLLLLVGCNTAPATSQQVPTQTARPYPYPYPSPVPSFTPVSYPLPTVTPSVLPYPYPYPPTQTPPPPYLPPVGVQPVPGPTVIVTYAAPVFGLVLDETMRVVYVEPDGGAARGGIRPGDILTSLAGVAIDPAAPDTLQRAREAAYAQQPEPPASGSAVLVVVERNGNLLQLVVTPLPYLPRITPGANPATATPVPASYSYL